MCAHLQQRDELSQSTELPSKILSLTYPFKSHFTIIH